MRPSSKGISWTCSNSMMGALGFSALRIWPIFGSVFRFSHLKMRFISFGVMHGLRVFSNLAFGFRFLPTMIAFLDLNSVQCIQYVSFGFVTPCSRAVTPRNNL